MGPASHFQFGLTCMKILLYWESSQNLPMHTNWRQSKKFRSKIMVRAFHTYLNNKKKKKGKKRRKKSNSQNSLQFFIWWKQSTFYIKFLSFDTVQRENISLITYDRYIRTCQNFIYLVWNTLISNREQKYNYIFLTWRCLKHTISQGTTMPEQSLLIKGLFPLHSLDGCWFMH